LIDKTDLKENKTGMKMGSPMKWRIIGLIVLLLSLIVIVLLVRNFDTPSPRQVDIAIYAGQGTWDESVQAAKKMFEWMNYTVENLSAQQINNGLENFRILCIPGGNMYDYAQDISSEGKENIRSFVHDGGGYIGICGGAYFASEKVYWQGSKLPMTPLRLFSGTATGSISEIMDYPKYTMCKVNLMNAEHPITKSGRNFEWVLYYWGPALIPNANANVTVLGNYDKGNQTAMLTFEYGYGKVFLIGTHPEIDEDSDRDEVSFGDEFDDKGSEWDLMQRVVLWCLKKSNP